MLKQVFSQRQEKRLMRIVKSQTSKEVSYECCSSTLRSEVIKFEDLYIILQQSRKGFL